jgi:hypothetical protein
MPPSIGLSIQKTPASYLAVAFLYVDPQSGGRTLTRALFNFYSECVKGRITVVEGIFQNFVSLETL